MAIGELQESTNSLNYLPFKDAFEVKKGQKLSLIMSYIELEDCVYLWALNEEFLLSFAHFWRANH